MNGRSSIPQHHRSPCESAAERRQQHHIASFESAGPHRGIEGDADGRRRGVAVAVDVVEDPILRHGETLCDRLNDPAVGLMRDHQRDDELRDGDIVSVDCGTVLNGYVGDSAYTFCCGEVSEEVKLLLKRTKESLYKGIEAAVAGNRIGDIGYAVQNYVEQFGYGVVRELVGHGVGRRMHEDPQVPNYGKRGTGTKLSEGMVLAIEPMITLGKKEIVQERDGWTICTRDRKPAAHFEHDIAVRHGKAEILSSFEWAEAVENNQ